MARSSEVFGKPLAYAVKTHRLPPRMLGDVPAPRGCRPNNPTGRCGSSNRNGSLLGLRPGRPHADDTRLPSHILHATRPTTAYLDRTGRLQRPIASTQSRAGTFP